MPKYFGPEPNVISSPRDYFSGTGSQTNFVLRFAPGDTNGVLVMVDGVVQRGGRDYSVTTTNLTFAVAPPTPSGSGSNIEVVYLQLGSTGINTTWKVPVASNSGTVNVITASYSPPISSLVNGLIVFVVMPNGNTSRTPTFSPNGLTAKTVVNRIGNNLAPSELLGTVMLRYDSTISRWVHIANDEGFLQAGTGALQRTVADKLKDYISVKDFGAVGDGLTDDTAAFQAAAAATTSGMRISVPHGNYKVTASTTINKPVVFSGDNPVSTTISPNGNFDVFSFSGGVSGAGIGNLSIDATSMTGGNCISGNSASNICLENLQLLNPFNGISFQSANDCSLRQVSIEGVRNSYGVKWYGDNSTPSDVLDVDNVEISCSSNTVGAVGFLVDGNVGGLDIRHVSCSRMSRGLWAKNTSGSTRGPSNINAYDFQIDSPYYEAIRLEGSGRGYFFTDLYAHGSTTADGVFVDSSIQEVNINGGQIDGHYKRGIYCNGRYMRVTAHVSNNSVAGSALWPGVQFGSASGGCQVIGGMSGQRVGYATNNQSYGVQIDSGATSYVIVGVNLRLNVTGEYLDSSSDSNSVIFGNTGVSVFSKVNGPIQSMNGDLYLHGSGINAIRMGNASNGIAFEIQASDPSTVNNLKVYGKATGAAPTLGAVGADSDIDVSVMPKGTGNVQLGGVASYVSNGTVAAVIGAVGPIGSHTAVQEWLVIKNGSGVLRYIPLF